MNIVQLQDLLKGLPDNRLKQEMDQPTGSVPQYLVLSEIVRRDKMRTTGMAQSPTTTVVQDVMSQKPGPQMMPPEQMQQEQAPQGYASGGFISASDAMGSAGVRGFAPPAPKQPMMFGNNQPGQGMFTPNTAPKAPAPITNNSFSMSQPQPQFDGGQMNDFNSPSFYQQGAYANGGAIRYDLGGKITSAESGGDARAKNPLSSATGAGQFISSTWLAMLEKMKPGLISKIGREAALELRNDPVLSKQAVDLYAAENRNMLTRRGFEPTEGNIYLAHFAGPGGASALLGADPSASAAEVLGPQVLKANPFLKDMSVADIKNWAAKKMGASAPAPQQGMAGRETTRGLGEGAGGAAVGYDPLSNAGGIASLPQDKSETLSPELASLGRAMAGGNREMPQMDIPKMSPGSAELAAGTRTASPEDQLAQYAALRRGYMAGGGAVRMREGELVEPGGPTAADFGDVPPGYEPTAPMTDFIPESVFRIDTSPQLGSLEEGPQTEAEPVVRESGGDRGPETLRGPSESVGRAELARRARWAAEEEAKKPSAQDDYIEYLKDRDAKLAAMYDEQLKLEREQQAQATGLPAFLRQMGLGMLSNNRSMGESLQAGLSGAMGAREEQGAAARDRIRALQLKKQMGGIEGLGDTAKLKYESAIAQASQALKDAREGKATQADYLKAYTTLKEAYTKALGEGNVEASELSSLLADMEAVRPLAGFSSATSAPRGTLVTEGGVNRYIQP